MIARPQVQSVLDRIRPLLQADGGDLQLVDVRDRKAVVRLLGKCAGCPSSHLTLHLGVEAALKAAIADFDELIVV